MTATNKTTTGENAAGPLTGAELVRIVQSGDNFKTTTGDIAGLFTLPTTTKGDLIVNDGTNNVRFPAGTDGYVLSCNSTVSGGLQYITPGVSSASLASTANGLGVDLVGGAGRVVNTISDLKALLKTGVGRAFVLGYYAAGDGGGGAYWYDSSDTTSTDNGGTIIVASDGGLWKLTHTGRVSLAQFGACASQANCSPMIQSAMNWATSIGGACLYSPPGSLVCASDLYIGRNTTLIGDGPFISLLKFSSATGNGINSLWPINSSTPVQISVCNIGIWNTSGTSIGKGFQDVGGSFINLDNVYFHGWKWGAVLDQTELGVVTRCDFDLGGSTGNLWLVNGADNTPGVTFTTSLALGATSGTLASVWSGATGNYTLNFVETAGGASELRTVVLTNGSAAVSFLALGAACNAVTTAANSGFTNRITIEKNQFNGGSVCNHVVDDGGTTHSINNNNMNAGFWGVRAAGVTGLEVNNNEIEIGNSWPIYLAETKLSGTYVGPCQGFTVNVNSFYGPASYNVYFDQANGGTVEGNIFSHYSVAALGINFGVNNRVTGVKVVGNSKLVSGPGITAGPFFDTTQLAYWQQNCNITEQQAVTYVSASQASGSQVVTPATMELITTNTQLLAINADGTNTEIVNVVSVTGTTFTATFASSKAANFQLFALPSAQSGTFTPVLSGATTAGTFTYTLQYGSWTRLGNRVYVTANVAWSAGTGTGQLQCSMPFGMKNTAGVYSPFSLVLTGPGAIFSGAIAAQIQGTSQKIVFATVSATTGNAAALAVPVSGTLNVNGHYELW